LSAVLPGERHLIVVGLGDGIDDFLLIVEVRRRRQKHFLSAQRAAAAGAGHGGSVDVHEGVGAAGLGVPERRGDWVLELEPTGLPVDLQGHHPDLGIVELHPGQGATVRGKPEGARVRQYFFLVDPIGDAVEDGAGDA